MPAHSTKSKPQRKKKNRASWEQMHNRRNYVKEMTGKNWVPLRIRKKLQVTDETQASQDNTGRQGYSPDISETKRRWKDLMYIYCDKNNFTVSEDCTGYCAIRAYCNGKKEPKFGYDDHKTKSLLDRKGF